MYEFETRIRYSELNSNGILSLPALLDYFQDSSIFHSEHLGLGLEYLEKNHMLWALSSWQIVINRCPKLNEKVLIGTAPYEFKGFIGCRNFWMKDEKEEKIAYANSVWSLIDTEKGTPVKPTAEMLEGYELAEKLDMEYADRHIKFAGEGKAFPKMMIKAHNLDTNLHVNNGQYIRIGMDYLSNEETLNIKQLRAEYKMQARNGFEIFPKRYDYNKNIGISLQDENGKPYCNMEFSI